MLTLKLAFRNITHAGIRTWLNVFILSFAFVLLIWMRGLYDGLGRQIVDARTDAEIGGGQYWQKNYDPYDPFTIEDSHSPLSTELQKMITSGNATPILVSSGAIFPGGRIFPARLKGIDPDQKIINFPSNVFNEEMPANVIPALIGTRMAESCGLEKGDYVTLRWKDSNGTFDAADIFIAEVMNTIVPTIDAGQIWFPLEQLREMLSMPDEATIVIIDKSLNPIDVAGTNWQFNGIEILLKDLFDHIERKNIGSDFMFALLLAMALLAVFDTQVLAIFRRRREMGTMMALGMTRGDVIKLFTLEGTLHGLLAIVAGAIYGIPILIYTSNVGLGLPEVADQVGIFISSRIYPYYGIQLFLASSIILALSVVIVSFLPTRKISKLKPTDALRGKMS